MFDPTLRLGNHNSKPEGVEIYVGVQAVHKGPTD